MAANDLVGFEQLVVPLRLILGAVIPQEKLLRRPVAILGQGLFDRNGHKAFGGPSGQCPAKDVLRKDINKQGKLKLAFAACDNTIRYNL